ncbi:succinyldiaminopimelate transaminase [Acidithiobacillus caldus]|nr:succinyldiaminopimelate transaminase [Acidithiobacillus caldus]
MAEDCGMNPGLASLQAYPFERLRRLLQDVRPPALPLVDFSIGEPRQQAPELVARALTASLQQGLAEYPKVLGEPALRQAIAAWTSRRFTLPTGFLDPDRCILPVNGTREALFSIAQTVINPCQDVKSLVLMPNPFYQIYEGAALLAGAKPHYLNCDPGSGQPDFRAIPESVWERSALLYVNSPHNPTGAALGGEELAWLVGQARRFGVVLAVDECYTEIYFRGPPTGVLSVAAQTGSLDSVLSFHSLSKRSSIPGARSGFVAGDPAILAQFLRYRTYLGAAMPPFIQAASRAAWSDEEHVVESRRSYARKFAAARDILGEHLDIQLPDGGFYLWPEVGDGEAFARELYAAEHVRCLPGAYLAREAHGLHPGHDRVRIALVGSEAECIEGLQRIRRFLDNRPHASSQEKESAWHS